MNTIAEQNRILTDLFVLLDARERKTGWEWIQERAALTEAALVAGKNRPVGTGGGSLGGPGLGSPDAASVSAVQMELE